MTRKLISLVLALCMIMSCFAISGLTASAATAPDAAGTISGGQTIYFQPASNWKNDGARFALYYYGNSDGWVSFTAVDSNIYQATIPAGTWEGVVFARMNGDNQTNNWDNKWNQTANVTSQDSGKNLYVQPDNTWDAWTGSWNTYNAQQTTTEEVTTVETTTVDDPYPNAIRVTVTAIDDAPGSTWAAWTWDEGQDGTWVTIQSFGYVPVKSKVLFANFSNPNVEKTWGNVQAQTVDFDVQNHKMLTLSKTKEGNKYTGSWSDDGYFGGEETTAEPTTAEPTTTVEPTTAAPEDTITVYFDTANSPVSGTPNFYVWKSSNNQAKVAWPGEAMTQVSGTIYTATFSREYDKIIFNGNGQTGDLDVPANDNYIYQNGAWAPYGEEPTTVEPTTMPEPSGLVTVYFDTANSPVSGTPNYYVWRDSPVLEKEAEWPGRAMTPVSGTIYSATFNVKYESIIFNGNGQTSDLTIPGTEYIYQNGEWKPYGDEPGTTAEITTAPVGTEYYLCGYINGANYACEEDSANLGQYQIVNGRIYAAFTQDSYVYVKDNKGHYFMTDGYPGNEATSATLYDTSVTGENSDKLRVPGGKTAYFTFVINGDGTYTLSYVTDTDPSTTAEPTTVEPTTAPENTVTVYFDTANTEISGTPDYYAWQSSNDQSEQAWPGKAMTYVSGTIYSATFDAKYDKIIFNNGSNVHQTSDLTIPGTNYIYQNGAWAPYGEEPTTEEPTTVEPTTEEPTTVEPTTEEPTTVEPTTEPETEPESVTIKFVAPYNTNSSYRWNGVEFIYGKTGALNTVHMAAVDSYYTADMTEGLAAIAKAGAWTVYTTTIPKADFDAIDNAALAYFKSGDGRNSTVKTVGKNVFKAGINEYDAAYSNDKTTIANLDGFTFIVKDCLTAASPYTSQAGYWTAYYNTVRMAAPNADNKNSNWDAVSLYYGPNNNDHTELGMINTGETTKVTDLGDMDKLRAGRWYIYAVTLDALQSVAVNESKQVGFRKPDAINMTPPSKNVLKALTNEYTGNYASTARTVEELDGQVFVFKAKNSATSQVLFNGEWQTADVYTAGNNDTVTLYFAAPLGADGTSAAWDTGVELYYGTSTSYKTTTRIEMTPVDTTMAVTTTLPTLKSGNWAVYAVELTAAQISAIDAVNYVGFIKTGTYNRTSILYSKNIARAPTTDDGTYTKTKQSIEAFDGLTFVIDSCADANNERTSYTGYWK